MTPDERELLERVADSLGIAGASIPEATTLPQAKGVPVGGCVCFTGSAMVEGEPLGRDSLTQMAVLAGLVPVPRVTKKCDLLVAADTASSSGKARKAREYGIPVMSVDDFWRCLT